MLATSGNVLETKQRSRSPKIHAENCPVYCHVHTGLLESLLSLQNNFCKMERCYRTRDEQMQRLQRLINSQYIPTLLQYLLGSAAVRGTFCISKKPIASSALWHSNATNPAALREVWLRQLTLLFFIGMQTSRSPFTSHFLSLHPGFY